jgi:hypothetical protein
MTRPGGLAFEWPSAIRRVQAAFRGHPYRQDVLLAVVVLLLGFAPQAAARKAELLQATPMLLVSEAIQCLVLVWRRKAPFAVYCVVLVSCTVQWAMGENSSSNVSLMICLFTLARYWSLRRLLIVAGASSFSCSG